MTRFSKFGHKPRRIRSTIYFRPEVEQLDFRCLPSVVGGASVLLPLIEAEPNDTLDVAQKLGDPGALGRVEVLGSIGNGKSGAADVDWYSFTLDAAAQVNLTIVGQSASSQPILSLYNSNPDPFDFSDPFAFGGSRLLQQTADHQAAGSIERDLAAGTYYVAISGSGNLYFNPFLAGSGYAGQVGSYSLTVAAVPLTQNAGDGPIVLASDPTSNGLLTGSPFVVRIDLNAPLDPNTLNPGGNVRLIYNATGTFGDGTDQDVNLSTYNYTPGLMELQLTPSAPLQPGFYQIFLEGDSSSGDFVLADPVGVPLGANQTHPLGQNWVSTFQITGIEGQTKPQESANDTASGAVNLGELSSNTLVQVTGAIGDDPYYDPNLGANPAADVDMYHFHISGPGNFAFSAEVFAGRIGSPLDAGISLFRMDPATQQLVFVGGNDNTNNPSVGTNGSVPLFVDPALFVGLTQGDYYLAVTSNFNTPMPDEGLEPGSNGIFDPNVSHSGTAGSSTGPYVLNMLVRPDSVPPTVLATTPTAGTNLNAPPTMLAVQFSETMNLRSLFLQAFEQNSQETVAAIYVQGADGTRYFPRMDSYDDTTNTANFLMLDALANGSYTLHLSGLMGVTDLAGQAIVGNDLSGDYVVPFTVSGSPRGTNGDPLQWSAQEPNDTYQQPQNIGVLFPHELQTGVVIIRDSTAGASNGLSDTADYFKIEVLQTQQYGLLLDGLGLPATVRMAITDLEGNPLPSFSPTNRSLTIFLAPGTYLVRVGGWTAGQAPQVSYQLTLNLIGTHDSAPPLTVGPGPSLQLRLASSESGTPPPPPQVIVPPTSSNGTPAPQAPGGDRIVQVSFLPASNFGQGANIVIPSSALLQLASTPLGGLPTTPPIVSLGTMDGLVLDLPELAPHAALNPGVLADSASSWWDTLLASRWTLPIMPLAEVVTPHEVITSDYTGSVQGEIGLEANPEPSVSQVDLPTVAYSSLARPVLWLATLITAGTTVLLERKKKRAVSVVQAPVRKAKSIGEKAEVLLS